MRKAEWTDVRADYLGGAEVQVICDVGEEENGSL